MRNSPCRVFGTLLFGIAIPVTLAFDSFVLLLKDSLPFEDLPLLDRAFIARLAELQRQLRSAYEGFDFCKV